MERTGAEYGGLEPTTVPLFRLRVAVGNMGLRLAEKCSCLLDGERVIAFCEAHRRQAERRTDEIIRFLGKRVSSFAKLEIVTESCYFDYADVHGIG